MLLCTALAPAPGHAAAVGTTATCYNCSCFTGTRKCESGGFIGGSSCTADQDSCSVSGDCSTLNVLSWYNDPLTPDDVQTLINEVTIGLEPTTESVAFKATLEPFGTDGDLLLRVIPTQPSDLDPPLSELLVYLAPDGSDGPHSPYSWQLLG